MSARATDEVAYETPETVGEVHRLLAGNESAKLVAGGQSLMLMLRQGLVDAELLVDISGVPELNGIEVTDDRVAIGSATTYSELASHDLADRYAELREAVRVIADEQVRNMGTIGGALSHADPSLDIVPPLLCLEATVTLSSADGRRSMPLREFLQGYMTTALRPDEVLEGVTFEPRESDRVGGTYEKHTKVEGGWATVGVGSRVTLSEDGRRFDTVRLSLAAAAYTTVRATSVEEALESGPVTDDAVESAASTVTEDIDPIADPSGSVAYKEHLATTLTRRAVAEAVTNAGGELR